MHQKKKKKKKKKKNSYKVLYSVNIYELAALCIININVHMTINFFVVLKLKYYKRIHQ